MSQEKLRLIAFASICLLCLLLMAKYGPKSQVEPTKPNIPTKNEKVAIDPKPEEGKGISEATEKLETSKPQPEKETEKAPKAIYSVSDTPEKEAKKIEVKTKVFRLVFNSKGGILETLELLDFKKNYEEKSPIYKLIDRLKNNATGCFAVLGLEESFSNATFEINTSKMESNHIIIVQSVKSGIKVEKVFTIHENEYDFDFKIIVTNLRSSDIKNNLKVVGVSDMEFDFHDTNSLMNDQIATMIDEGGDFISAGDIHMFSKTYGARQGLSTLKEETFIMGPLRKTKNERHDKATVVWGGLKNRYFTVIQKPKKVNWSVNGLDLNPESLKDRKMENTVPQLVWVASESNLAAGESFQDSFLVYAGPLKTSIINSPRLEETRFVEMIDYGFMFPRFIKVFDWILNFIIKYIGEAQYWLAIILLTLLVRGCMFPITKKSSMSQAKLQAVTPKMKDLKEKYKNDTKKLNEEMMKLYRKEGVNPFTSCLPMLIQMPIFIGLYWTFNLTFEVRFKEFLWINDLAVDDHLFPLGFTIPLLGSYFNLLPIIYSVINYITMANMPPAQDEMQAQQQKIMKYMFPVMMLLFFYRMPSALVLYFIVSGTWSIVEQKQIRKKLEAMKATP